MASATTQEEQLIAEGTLLDPVVHKHPRQFYAAMRKLDPVHYDKSIDMYLISRWEDIQEIQRDPITYSVNKGYHEQQAKGFAEEFQQILREKGGGYFPDAIMSDPPYHTRVRKLMENAFTAHRVKELEPRIEAVVNGLIDEIEDRGEMDAVKDFAQPLTIRIICEQLGLDWHIKDRIARWSIAVTAQIGRMQDRAEMLEHAAAGFHRRQLVGVPDEHHLRAPGHRGRQQFFQLGGADHGGFVDDDHGAPVDGQIVVLDEFERLGHGQAAVAGFLLHRLVDGFAGGREHEHFFVRPVRGGAQRFQ